MSLGFGLEGKQQEGAFAVPESRVPRVSGVGIVIMVNACDIA